MLDYAARFMEAAGKIVPWLLSGKLKYRLDVVVENAPAALNKLFDGTNTDKLLVKLVKWHVAELRCQRAGKRINVTRKLLSNTGLKPLFWMG